MKKIFLFIACLMVASAARAEDIACPPDGCPEPLQAAPQNTIPPAPPADDKLNNNIDSNNIGGFDMDMHLEEADPEGRDGIFDPIPDNSGINDSPNDNSRAAPTDGSF